MRGGWGSWGLTMAWAMSACTSEPRSEESDAGPSTQTLSATSGETSVSASDTSSTTGSTGPDTGTPKLDVEMGETEGPGPTPTCKVADDMDAVPDCDDTAPPNAFELDTQWTWDGPDGYGESMAIALVANLTDDDGNEEIDLCDVPDIVVTTYAGSAAQGRIFLLDGETGTEHGRTPDGVVLYGYMSPALGDIDGDGTAEIVSQLASGEIIAFEHDLTEKWRSTDVWPAADAQFGAIALADVDNDGDVEILAGNRLYDHLGALVQTFPDISGVTGFGNSSAAVDLDGDNDLEIVLGQSAWHHDGSMYYSTNLAAGIPSVADLDMDGLPEVLLHSGQGVSLIEHDGTVTISEVRPTGAASSNNAWHRPSCVHDFDSNGDPEIGISAGSNYGVFEPDLMTSQWLATVADGTGVASGTAFDFLGDGGAEAMYADETQLFIFDDTGGILLQDSRSSRTLIEYPVVADVDNDGSAEIVVVSNAGFSGQTAPTVQVFRDIEDRWIQARRIWNQHSYHVTNVREDGTIPMVEPHHWDFLNTFRTNAQIENGGVCTPPPAG